MQLIALLVAAWYVGRLMFSREGKLPFALVLTRIPVGMMMLSFFLFSSDWTSATVDYGICAVIAVAGLALSFRKRSHLPSLDVLRPLVPVNLFEWLCCGAVALSFFFGFALLFAPAVLLGEGLVQGQSVNSFRMLGTVVYDDNLPGGDMAGYAPILGSLYGVAGITAMRLLSLLSCCAFVAAAATSAGFLGGRSTAWVTAALCASAPAFVTGVQGLPPDLWPGIGLVLLPGAILHLLQKRDDPTFLGETLFLAILGSFATMSPQIFPAVLPFLLFRYGAFPKDEQGKLVSVLLVLSVLAASGAVMAMLLFLSFSAPLETAQSLWDNVMRPQDREAWAWHPGAAVFALGIPALFMGSGPMRVVVFSGLVGVLLGAFTGFETRDVYASYLLMLTGGAALVTHGPRGRKLLAALAVVLVAGGLLYQGNMLRDRIPVMLGQESADAFRARHIPRIGAIDYCNTFHADDAIFLLEPLGFYSHGLALPLNRRDINRLADKRYFSHLDLWLESTSERRLWDGGLIVLPERAVLETLPNLTPEYIGQLETLRRDHPIIQPVRRLDLVHPVTRKVERVDILRVRLPRAEEEP